MAKRPKPVHQLTAAQFDAMFPDEEACAPTWSPVDGLKASIARAAAIPVRPSTMPLQLALLLSALRRGYRFSHIAGTIFENTNKPLKDWFRVTHLMLISKKGMSALQIMRYMGFGSYKTAWLMCHRIRVALD